MDISSTRTIRNSFNQAAQSYDRCDGVQRDVARQLAELFPARLTDSAKILEIGCGTGNLTELLRERYPRNPLWVMDLAPAMVDSAQRRVEARYGTGTETAWQAVDIRMFQPEVEFDLVASSSVLHWVKQLPETIRQLAGWIAPGGQMVCSVMTEGTLAELHEARRAVAPGKMAARHRLPQGKAVVSALLEAGLVVQAVVEQKIQERMASSLALFQMLGGLGVAAGFYGSDMALNRTELERLMRKYDREYMAPGGGVTVTWCVQYLSSIKA
ncbi:MAG: methyltransferase domain-containing protein [Dissulfurispiraceae bacterium]